VKTNLSLFRRILSDPDFVAGKTDTGYLARLFKKSSRPSNELDSEIAVIAAAVYSSLNRENGTRTPAQTTASSGWKHAARTEAIE
jgi:acetyl/propionyl-CoA carboxylase alpha subunit